jgi:hypothetical protein
MSEKRRKIMIPKIVAWSEIYGKDPTAVYQNINTRTLENVLRENRIPGNRLIEGAWIIIGGTRSIQQVCDNFPDFCFGYQPSYDFAAPKVRMGIEYFHPVLGSLTGQARDDKKAFKNLINGIVGVIKDKLTLVKIQNHYGGESFISTRVISDCITEFRESGGNKRLVYPKKAETLEAIY